MTTLEQFVIFANALPESDRAGIEQMLSDVMQSYQHDSLLSAEQISQVKRRMNDSSRKLASRASIEAIFGKPLPA
jgi:hypothetical protein